VYSDCGTNFVGADAALRSLFQAKSTEARRIGQALAEDHSGDSIIHLYHSICSHHRMDVSESSPSLLPRNSSGLW